ncbi:MAG: UDPGP type 1 family protein [Planctomycetota bacterium]|nr:UDPGP type 1 family protein [Planctomycetota bacterium]
MSDRLSTVRQTLEHYDQAHVLRFYDELEPAQQASLLDELEDVDFVALAELIEQHRRGASAGGGTDDLEPASYYPNEPADPARPYDAARFRGLGEEAIRAGRVAAFTVAGGQGTRLGWKGPKGAYPATVVTGKPLFRCFAEQIRAAEKRYGVTIPWYIMTSPINDADTRAFFSDNNCFGLRPKNVFMFPQGMMPAVDAETGRLLLAEKHGLALSPDGHGGSIKALRDSGAIEDMRARGIEHISYFQVDNPLVKTVDPLFIGLHCHAPDSSAEMSSKMIAKAYPEEKVGVFCSVNGKTTVIEYSDLPEHLAQERDASGRLRFIAGSIAIHIISVGFVERLTRDAHHFGLPYHRALKKVPHVDLETGRIVEPRSPNGVKFETFVFDALPLAESSIVYETDRIEEFAPIKNATGVDSVESSHRLQSERAGRWLEAHGVTVARDGEKKVAARIEISPLTALEPADLVAADLPREIAADEEILL